MMPKSALWFGVAAALAACAQTAPSDPVGLVPAEAYPPQEVAPSGLLGEAEVGTSSLSDPANRTVGDPFL